MGFKTLLSRFYPSPPEKKLNIKLRFLGAAGNVTGSRHLLEFDGTKILIDCGLFQEREFQSRNWEDFGFDPSSLSAVLLTHAHLDHCGLLPKLVKEGFRGPVFCTAATGELAQIVLLDSGKIQEEDAEFKRKRHKRAGYTPPRPVAPLYTMAEAQACFGQFKQTAFRRPIRLGPGVEATFHEAGHILGASVIKIKVCLDGHCRTILYTGDLGRANKPILRDPEAMEQADYVLVESTYGDREHSDAEDAKRQLAEAVNQTWNAGGNLVVPSFSIERSQEILYYMNELLMEDKIPHLTTFLDSPMAVRVIKIFEKYSDLYDQTMAKLVRNNESPFSFKGLKLVESTRESKAINHIKGTIMIIAGSGMCTGGRIKHHLVNNIARPESTILFVGYQAKGTLGRRILDGEPEVRILGQTYPVKANVVRAHGFSSHADRKEILDWLRNIKNRPRKIFLVHGEKGSALNFKTYLQEQTGWDVMVPDYQDEVVIE
ncbi:MAG TPA: MBL fold metallo-hydrolase [Anaerohalosphaeraceae bacterium]|jgi:metallo-beta-lactamase family protein|nr:MBL fold metallo-hydrolase [Anaerohalosphaeraceae bacterium]